jgi:hypothetical protein
MLLLPGVAELRTVSSYSAMLRCLKFIEFEILLPIELKINRKFVVTRIFENIYTVWFESCGLKFAA